MKRSQGGRGKHHIHGHGSGRIRARSEREPIANEPPAPIEEAVSALLGLVDVSPATLAAQLRPVGPTRADRQAAKARLRTVLTILQSVMDTLEADPEMVIAGPFDEVVIGNWDGAMKVVDVPTLSHAWHRLVCLARRCEHDFDDPVDDLPALRLFDEIRRPAFSVLERPDTTYVGMRHHPRMFNRAITVSAGHGSGAGRPI